MSHNPYKEKDFAIPHMKGFSEKQIVEHLKLYSGYVKNINGLVEDIYAIEQKSEESTRVLSELQRRFAFEWNGMRMHEYYFEALGGNGDSSTETALQEDIEKEFGSMDKWTIEFKTIGKMRGVGWVAFCHDTRSGSLFNIWINDHEIGHLAGVSVILAMDVWEHAFLIDYLPSERGLYIESFFKNIRWNVIGDRYTHSLKNKI